MKRFIILCCVILSAVATHAQQLHFAYLQTDTHKPFYVIFNKKTYSSTASGYIILPKLQTGDFPVRIGFAKSDEAEQEYLLQVKEADQGLLIKNFGDKGWGLFNMQTLVIQYAGVAAQERAKLAAAEKAEAERVRQLAEKEAMAKQAKQRDDSLQTAIAIQKQYADSMAAIATQNTIQRNYNDSVAMVKTLAEKQQHYTDSINNANAIVAQQKSFTDSINNAKVLAAQQKSDTDSVKQARITAAGNERLKKTADDEARARKLAIEKEKNKTPAKPDIKAIPTVSPDSMPPHIAGVDLHSETPPVLLQQIFTDSGWHYAYRVTNRNQRETVDVFIPAAQPKLPVVTVISAVEIDTVNKTITLPADTVKVVSTITLVEQDTVNSVQKPVQETSQTNQATVAGKIDTKSTSSTDTIAPLVDKSIINSNCKAVANENDFYNTRKKIAAAIGTDQMLAVARKQLKDKCYTTDQLRNLCVLFLTDEGRYRFLDAAYPFAFDAYHYQLLQDLLLDDYYVQRFKAMLR